MPDLNLISHPLVGTPYGTALDLCLILAARVDTSREGRTTGGRSYASVQPGGLPAMLVPWPRFRGTK